MKVNPYENEKFKENRLWKEHVKLKLKKKFNFGQKN